MRGLGRGLKTVSGLSAAHSADGGCSEHGKGDEGPSCPLGPLAEKATSSSKTHSPLAAKALLQLQREREVKGALLCLSWDMLS